MNGIRPEAGSYRNHGVRITGVNLVTANYMSIRKLILEIMCEAIEKTKDIIGISTKVHAKFEQIHPFSDGNGRIGRLLMNAMFLRKNIAPAIIHQEKKQLYYTYLYKAQTTGDCSQLEDFICEAVMDGFAVLDRTDT